MNENRPDEPDDRALPVLRARFPAELAAAAALAREQNAALAVMPLAPSDAP